MNAENVDPSSLGYDRPSPKLLGFLRKHYGLSEYDPQSNNFVVFKSYFRGGAPARGAMVESDVFALKRDDWAARFDAPALEAAR